MTTIQPGTPAEGAIAEEHTAPATLRIALEGDWWIETTVEDRRVGITIHSDPECWPAGEHLSQLVCLHAADARLFAAGLIRFADLLDLPYLEGEAVS